MGDQLVKRGLLCRSALLQQALARLQEYSSKANAALAMAKGKNDSLQKKTEDLKAELHKVMEQLAAVTQQLAKMAETAAADKAVAVAAAAADAKRAAQQDLVSNRGPLAMPLATICGPQQVPKLTTFQDRHNLHKDTPIKLVFTSLVRPSDPKDTLPCFSSALSF